MAELSNAGLETLLRASFAPPATRPDEACWAAMHAALAELDASDAPVVLAEARSRRERHARTRRATSRTSVLVAGTFAFALTAGVAAAAVATNTLPGPLRGFAYDLGLPVTSPGLERAQQVATRLQQAIRTKDAAREKALSTQLVDAMKSLNKSDLASISALADHLLGQLGVTLPTSLRSTTGTDSPSLSTPIVAVPSVRTPGVTVPGLTIPRVTTPTLTTPTITVPPVTVPPVTVPPVTVPTVTVPTGTVPPVTIPPVTVPTVTIPPVTTPTINTPTVTIPGLSISSSRTIYKRISVVSPLSVALSISQRR